jgi:hypothetical protein
MPSYSFINIKTNKEWDDIMTIAEMEEYLSKNPHIRQVPKRMNIVAGVSGITYKNDQGFKEVLSKISEAHPQSALAQQYGKKSIKQVKTEQVIKKHRARQKSKTK